MDLTRQIVQILSEPPGSFIYHLITLFALQVVFAISYSRWRRQPDDDVARNMSYAAGAIFAGRLVLLITGIFYGSDPQNAAAVLPPLEQAINTASIVLLVWSLVPRSERYPRVFDIMLITTLILIGVMYLFFAQEWQNQATAGTPYHGTQQASIWALLQITILAVGLGYLLIRGRFLGALPPIIIGTLLIAHVVHLWNYPEFIPSDTNVAYWVRLGNLIALPLWAVYAYQHAMTPLLESESRLQSSVEKFSHTLDQAAQVIATQQPQRRLVYALELINQMFDSSFAAIGLIDSVGGTAVTFYSAFAGQPPGEIKSWDVDLVDHVTLSAALGQDGSTELLRDGLGSRQLYSFFQSAGQEPSSSLLIHPLITNGNRLGLLVIPGPDNEDRWSDEAKNLVPGLSHFVAQAIVNGQTPPASEPESSESRPEPAAVAPVVPAAIVIDRVRVQDLEYQLEQMREALKEAEQKRKQAEVNSVAAQKQARYLAAALRTVQAGQNNAVQPDEQEPPSEELSKGSVQSDSDRIS